MSGGGVPSVWVLVHDLDRTGVPVVLARLLRATPDARSAVHVVALRGGALEPEVAAASSTVTTLEPTGRRSAADALGLGLGLAGAPGIGSGLRRRAWRHRVRHLPPPDVVVVHGAGAWALVDLVPTTVPVVLHLHELHVGLDRSIDPVEQRSAFRRAARVLAVSRPVADLALARGAAPGAVELLPGVVEPSAEVVGAAASSALGAVMGAGVPGWRKGTDRLAAVAHHLGRAGRADQVAWLGGAPGGVDAPFVGSPDPVRWSPPRAEPWSVMAAAEVIVVPSREDPLPLVALEAGLHGRAVVAMPTGGLPDLLADGRGVCVASQDVGSFAGAVADLLVDQDRAGAMGAALRRHVVAHHDAGLVAPRWWELVSGIA